MKPHSQLTSSLLLSVVGLAVLAAGTAVIIVCVPRTGPSTVSSPEHAEIVADPNNDGVEQPVSSARKSPAGQDDDAEQRRQVESPVAAGPSVDSGTPPGSTTPEKPAPEDGRQPSGRSTGPASVTEGPAPPASPSPRRGAAARDQWRMQSTSVSTRVFLLDAVDGVGVRRVAFPAPADRRYVLVAVSLTWEGRQPRSVLFEVSSSGPPTLRLAAGTRWYDPLGRVADSPDPFALLTTDPVVVGQRETVTLKVAFLLPDDVDTVSLVMDRKRSDAFALPPSDRVDPSKLHGAWDKAEGQLQPLRYEDPLADALADPKCRLMWIARNAAGFLELNVPAASIRSNALSVRGDSGTTRFTLIRGEYGQPGRLRAIEGGSSLLLYVGEPPGAVFLFGRCGQGAR